MSKGTLSPDNTMSSSESCLKWPISSQPVYDTSQLTTNLTIKVTLCRVFCHYPRDINNSRPLAITQDTNRSLV